MNGISSSLSAPLSWQDFRLVFRRNIDSVISLRRSSRTRSTVTILSDATPYGPGSDLGRFMYWFGERIIDGYSAVVIHARLASVRRTHSRRHSTSVRPRFVRQACQDLVAICECACLIFNVPYESLTHENHIRGQRALLSKGVSKGIVDNLGDTASPGCMVLDPLGVQFRQDPTAVSIGPFE